MELAQLRKRIDSASRAYYGSGKTDLSDSQYDRMLGELRQLCPGDPRLTQVGPRFSASDLRTKVDHKIPMGSLDNTEGGINGFDEWYCKLCDKVSASTIGLVASHKVDGNSAAAYYEKGELVRVVTRGNGIAGDDMTANAVLWKNLPTSLPKPLTISVRGEAVLPKAAFDKLNSDGQHNNPRNLCAGIIGRKSDGGDNQHIEFHAFNSDSPQNTLHRRLEEARELGFQPVNYIALTGEAKDIQRRVRNFFNKLAQGERENLPYEIDGVVVAVDDLVLQEMLTESEQDAIRPKHSRAIKFETVKATTKVVGVTITLGHTGQIIPTAMLEPVRMGGVTVSNALLLNWNADSEFPSAAHIAVGDVVELERAGDVIPKVVGVATPVFRNPQDGFIGTLAEIEAKYGMVAFDECDSSMPGVEHCVDSLSGQFECRRPYIRAGHAIGSGKQVMLERPTIEEPKEYQGQPTTRFRRGKEMASTFVDLDSDHPEIRKQKVKKWIGTGKKGIGIRGVGDSVLDALTGGSNPLVKSPADLYKLTVAQIAGLSIGTNASGGSIALGTSRASALVEQIQANRELGLTQFLGGLGVDLLGERRVELIAKETGLMTLDDWLDETKLARIQGDTIRTAIIGGLREARPTIDALLAVGVVAMPYAAKTKPKPPQPQGTADMSKNGHTATLDLTGKSFCFTGVRDADAEAQIEAAGGEIKTTVSAKYKSGLERLTHLVQKSATSQSGKTKKADELGVKVISLDTLQAVLAGERDLP